MPDPSNGPPGQQSNGGEATVPNNTKAKLLKSTSDLSTSSMPNLTNKKANAARTVNFFPGPSGLVYDDSGCVTSAPPGSQAAFLGVREGWLIVKVAEQDVAGQSKDAVDEAFSVAKQSHGTYSVVFDDPEAPDPSNASPSEPAQEKKSSQAQEWMVTIDNSRKQPLGLDLSKRTMLIEEVLGEGLFADWNKENKKKAVQSGDKVLEVNGLLDHEKIFAELKLPKKLRFKLHRKAVSSLARSSQASDGKVVVWKVVLQGGPVGVDMSAVNVREEKHRWANVIGQMERGARFQGWQEGAWVRLVDGGGYVMIESSDQGVLLEEDMWIEVDQVTGEETAIEPPPGNDDLIPDPEAGQFDNVVAEHISHIIDSEKVPEVQNILRQSIAWATVEKNAEVPVGDLMSYLENEDMENRNFGALLFSGIMLVLYVITFVAAEDIAGGALLQRQIHGMLTGTTYEGVYTAPTFSGHKIFQDIDTIEDIYMYFHEAVLPLFLPEHPEKQLADGVAPSELTRVLRYNRLIGGIQMQQQRRVAKPCSVANPNQGPTYEAPGSDIKSRPLQDGFTCYPQTSMADMTDDCFGPLDYRIRKPGLRHKLPHGFCADQSTEGLFDRNGTRRLADELGEADVVAQKLTRVTDSISMYSSSWWSKAIPWYAGEESLTRTQPQDFKESTPRPPANRPTKLFESRRKRRRENADSRARQLDDADPRRLRMRKHRDPVKTPTSLSWYTGAVRFLDAPSYTVMMNSGAGLQAAVTRLDWLFANKWVDLHSQYVGARLFMLNAEVGKYNHATINIYFGAGGEIMQMVNTNTFSSEPLGSTITPIVGLGLLCLIFAGMFFSYYLGVYRAFAAQPRTHLQFFSNLANWSDFLTIHFGIVLIGMTALDMFSVVALQDEIVNMHECGNQTATGHAESTSLYNFTGVAADVGGMQPDDPRYSRCVLDMHNAAEAHVLQHSTYRLALACYAVLLTLRFFRAFSMQPKLAMVTTTLFRASDQVFHHVIIMIIMVMSYAVIGMISFGRINPGFATFPLAIAMCFSAMLGDFDMDNTLRDPVLAGFWFWSFTAIIAMILLNCLMAIVMDVYTEVKSSAMSFKPIWTHLWLFFQDSWQSMSYISLPVIMRGVRGNMPQEPGSKIDAIILTKLIPGMTETQSKSIISGAVERMKIDEEMGASLSDALQLVGNISVTVKKMLLQLDVLVLEMDAERADFKALADLAQKQPRNSETPSLPCRGFHDRAAAIEENLLRLEQLCEDSACWNAYRQLQLNEQFIKIEELLRNGEKILRERGAIQGLPPPGQDQAEPREPPPPALLNSAARVAERHEEWFV